MLPLHVLQYAEYRIGRLSQEQEYLEKSYAEEKAKYEGRRIASLFNFKYCDSFLCAAHGVSANLNEAISSLRFWKTVKNAATYQHQMSYNKFDLDGINGFHKPSFYEWFVDNKISR